ncbi:MAG: hypothetical protein KGZ75_13925 [Syntrophomonadaceae bacterium]|nr:hypothetical protein [Syntrophomonadaceae bacterium]
MYLPPGQHSVTAVFYSKDAADRAVRALQEAGINRITVDETLSAKCQTKQFSSFDAQLLNANRVLLGTDPSIRGNEPGMRHEHETVYIVANAVVTSSQLNLALKTIAANGGYV